MGVRMQVFGTVMLGGSCICMGLMISWPSSTYRLFESKNTTLDRPMTETELALLGSMSSIGALVSTPIAGVTLDRFGRKKLSIVLCLSGVVSWTMVLLTTQVEVLLTAIFVSGISGSALLVVTVYVSEICQESIRGAMCSATTVFYTFGMLISYLIGGYLDYYSMNYVCLGIAAVSTAAMCLLKESPTCLMIKGLEKEAAQSLAFYRSVKPDSKEILEELNNIRRALNPELDDMTPEEEKQLKLGMQTKQKLSLWQFIRKSSSTRRAIFLMTILVTASIFEGLVVVQVYAEPLFVEVIPSMSPTTCTVLFASVVVVAGIVAAYLSEVAGRRPLMIYTSFLASASCLLLGLQLHLRFGPAWLIAVNIYVFTTLYALGGGIIPYVLVGEVFLPEVKSFLSMAMIEWAWLCNSIILFIFNPLLKAIGLGPVFYIFASVFVITGVYCVFFLPETKGLTIDEIHAKFSKKRKIVF